MSASPPPFPIGQVDEKTINSIEVDLAASQQIEISESKGLSDDLFFSTISDPVQPEQKKSTEDMDELFRINSPTQQTSVTEVNKEIKLTEDEEDPFSFDSSKKTGNSSTNITNINTAAINIQPVLTVQKPTEEQTSSLTSSFKKQDSERSTSFKNSADDENDEDRDKFIEIELSNPTKVGDGMGSYMVYKILTKTNFPAFKSSEFGTTRRFSDFLNLYEKLKEKHLVAGRILPPAPEKDMIGMAKVKMSKEDSSPIDFIEKRRAALERFLNRLAKHKTFRFDPDFRDFIEIADDLPKATNTSTLSGAGMLKMFKNVTDSVSKIAIKIDETDQWFEEKTRQVENLCVQFRKMHSTVEVLYNWRKDLASSTKEFSKSLAILANSEEQLNLSRALSQLGEIYEKIDQLYLEQANGDYFIFCELLKDYVCLFENIKEVFYQRVKLFSNWQKAEETLRSKKDSKSKLEASNKLDKIPTVAAEIRDWEIKVEKSKEDFEHISKSIKEEIKRFDFDRAREFKTDLTRYLQNLLNNQEQLVKIWDQYLPQVKAI